MPIINRNSIIAKVLKANKTRVAAYVKVESRVLNAKTVLLNEFDDSEITKEILAGPQAQPSAVLPFSYGNLFSFLGFNEGDNPIERVRNLLENIHVIKKPITTGKTLNFRIVAPSNEDIENASPMTWESGRSWVHAITYGIGTFSHYMFSTMANRFKGSRSGTAIQVESPIPPKSEYLTGKSYLFGMLGRFRRKIGGIT